MFKRLISLAALVVACQVGGAFCLAQEPEGEKEKAAVAVAQKWLLLVDQEKYEESWKEASAIFRGAVTPQDWKRVMDAIRKPIGPTVTRKFKSAEYKTSMPGAPDGEYVIIQFETAFENKKSTIETVTPMMDKDGKWRVSGYFMK